MSKDQHASIPFFHGILCDLSENQTFATTAWDYHARVCFFAAEMFIYVYAQ